MESPSRRGKVREEYKASLDALIAHTPVKQSDLDQKAMMLLDALQRRGRAVEACEHLRQALDGLERERVSNWRAYIYTLLRKFDDTAYQEMKAAGGQEGGGAGAAGAAAAERRARGGRDSAAGAATPSARAAARATSSAAAAGAAGGGAAGGGSLSTDAQEFVPGVYWDGRLVGTTPVAYGVPTTPITFGHLSLAELFGSATGAAAMAPLELELGTPALPSTGSSGHYANQCKPCAFFHTKGCSNGVDCVFCHLCDAHAKKQRKKEKLALQKAELSPQAGRMSPQAADRRWPTEAWYG